MELPKKTKWSNTPLMLGITIIDIIDYLHDLTARVEKLEPKECPKEKCKWWKSCCVSPFICSRQYRDRMEPASQPEQSTISKKETVELGKKEEWREKMKVAKEIYNTKFSLYSNYSVEIIYDALTAAAKKIEEQRKELERVKDGAKDIISKINRIGSGYLIGDVSRDLEKLLGDK